MSSLVAGVGTAVIAAGLLLALMGHVVLGVVVMIVGCAVVMTSHRA